MNPDWRRNIICYQTRCALSLIEEAVIIPGPIIKFVGYSIGISKAAPALLKSIKFKRVKKSENVESPAFDYVSQWYRRE